MQSARFFIESAAAVGKLLKVYAETYFLRRCPRTITLVVLVMLSITERTSTHAFMCCVHGNVVRVSVTAFHIVSLVMSHNRNSLSLHGHVRMGYNFGAQTASALFGTYYL